jgi:glycosyltransferase involved in cell wall biosynthesis
VAEARTSLPPTVSKIKVSLVVTVLNEEDSIELLLNALRAQSFQATEIIITDGGSTDQTPQIIKHYQKKHSLFPLRFLVYPGNRSQGRNKAVELAKNELIAITDAGCVPHQDWLEELVVAGQKMLTKFATKDILLAGYYDAQPQNPFEQAVIPYVLVMPDQIKENQFLPATRSVLFTKSTWKKVGQFDETLADNEDYPFARKAQQLGISLGFTSKAKVTWIPRHTVSDFANMIFRYARGDAYSGAWRKKVLLLFARYAVGISFLLVALFFLKLSLALVSTFFVASFFLYSVWAIFKNYRYAPQGWYWLPLLQIVADLAVMTGTTQGFLARLLRFSIIAPHLKS